MPLQSVPCAAAPVPATSVTVKPLLTTVAPVVRSVDRKPTVLPGHARPSVVSVAEYGLPVPAAA